MTTRRPNIYISAFFAFVLALVLSGLRVAADSLPAQLSDQEFWKLSSDFSEPDGTARAIHVEAPASLAAVCDRFRFEQILTNLLSNALKYGQGQPVEVTLQADAQSVRLSVRDHGMGIAAEDRERIFEKFERTASARNYGGMGLGLYISRYLAEAHGGGITVDATVGEGAAFLLQIPRQPRDGAPV